MKKISTREIISLVFLWITFLLLIFIILYFFFVGRKDRKVKYKQVDAKSIKFDNCDLLCACIPNIYGKLIKFFTGSSLTHMGMIVMINNEPHVLEVGYYKNKRGSLLFPLDKWLDKFSIFDIVVTQYSGDVTSDEILTAFFDLTPCDIDMNVTNWLRTVVKFKNKNCEKTNRTKRKKTEYFCTEFIVTILQRLKVFDDSYRPDSYSPAMVMHGRVKTLKGKFDTKPLVIKKRQCEF